MFNHLSFFGLWTEVVNSDITSEQLCCHEIVVGLKQERQKFATPRIVFAFLALSQQLSDVSPWSGTCQSVWSFMPSMEDHSMQARWFSFHLGQEEEEASNLHKIKRIKHHVSRNISARCSHDSWYFQCFSSWNHVRFTLDTTCSEQLPGNIESCPGEGALPWVQIQLGVHQHVEVQGLAMQGSWISTCLWTFWVRGASQGCPGLSRLLELARRSGWGWGQSRMEMYRNYSLLLCKLWIDLQNQKSIQAAQTNGFLVFQLAVWPPIWAAAKVKKNLYGWALRLSAQPSQRREGLETSWQRWRSCTRRSMVRRWTRKTWVFTAMLMGLLGFRLLALRPSRGEVGADAIRGERSLLWEVWPRCWYWVWCRWHCLEGDWRHWRATRLRG